MKQRKILICGGTGFIGRNLVNYYSFFSEFQVYATYHLTQPFTAKGVNWIKADLTDKAQVYEALQGMDIIIQAAASTAGVWASFSRPESLVTDNIIMNSIIFSLANSLGIKHVLFFSCSIFLPSSDVAIKETDLDLNLPLHPNYFGSGWAKIYLEKLCEFHSRNSSTKFTVIRHSNVYGPFDRFDPKISHVLAASIHKIFTASDSIIVWGTGKEKRDFIYIDDLLSLVNKSIFLQPSNFSIYNCGSTSLISIDELILYITKILNKEKIKILYDNSKPTINTNIFLDTTKAKNELDWSICTDLDKGLVKTIEWYHKNLNKFN